MKFVKQGVSFTVSLGMAAATGCLEERTVSTSQNCQAHRHYKSTVFVLHQLLLVWSNVDGWNGQGM